VSSYRTDRELLLEQDPQLLSENLELTSIKDADWRHQKAAAVAGYNSVAELAVDELLGMVRELEKRVAALENR
jgi:hypothetical protein